MTDQENAAPARLEVQTNEAVAWTNEHQLGYLKDPACKDIPMAMWAKESAMSPVALYSRPAQEPKLPLQDLPMYWQGRANALGLLNDRRVEPDTRTQGLVEAYEECAKELRAALAAPLQDGVPPTKFSPGPAVEVRNQNDAIDEIVIRRGDVHIEQMDDSGWFMGVDANDASYWQFWFGAKNRKSHVEFRHTETVPAAENRDSLCQVEQPGNYEDRHPSDMVLHPLSEIREWDEALAVLGIQDSDQAPADAIRERDAEIERLRSLVERQPDPDELELLRDTVAAAYIYINASDRELSDKGMTRDDALKIFHLFIGNLEQAFPFIKGNREGAA